MLISVVTPLYNERDNVAALGARIEASMNALEGCVWECLLVNDGSTDGTRDAIEQICQNRPGFRGVHLSQNCGQSAALIAGMQRARGDIILTLDGDLQNDPGDFPKILALLEDYDCVFGFRESRTDAWNRQIASKIANRVRNWALRDGIRDTGCGLKGFRRCCLAHMVPFNGQHRFFAVLFRKAGLRIAECPVQHHPREFGHSKYGIHNRMWRGLIDLAGVAWLRTRYVPICLEGEDARD